MFIYGLFDPRNSELRYVGFTTKSLVERLRVHMSDHKKTHKNNWIKQLKSLKLRPEILLLQETNEQDWEFDEKWNIEYFRSIGCNLTNMTCGGDRPPLQLGKQSDDLIEKRISKIRGLKRSQETKDKMSKSMKIKAAERDFSYLTNRNDVHNINNALAKLTLDFNQRMDVIEKYWIGKHRQKDLALEYKTTRTVIRNIVLNRNKHNARTRHDQTF